MPNNPRMKLRIAPLLEIEPGSIARSGSFKVTFKILETRNLTELELQLKILNAGGYRFRQPEDDELSAFYEVTGANGLTATDFMCDPPAVGRQTQTVFIVRDESFSGEPDAALRVEARVTGGGHGKLTPVPARGAIAVLEGGLKKLVKDRFGLTGAAAQIPDFEAKARQFVREKQQELGGEFAGFGNLDPRTIVNAIMGRTDPQDRTVDNLAPVAKKLLDKEGLLGRLVGEIQRQTPAEEPG